MSSPIKRISCTLHLMPTRIFMCPFDYKKKKTRDRLSKIYSIREKRKVLQKIVCILYYKVFIYPYKMKNIKFHAFFIPSAI